MEDKKEEAYHRFTKTGFVIKGLIYVLSGTLAVIAAFGSAGKTIGRLGVIRWLEQLPFGSLLLVGLSIGLLGYILLRFMQAIRDTNHKGRSWKGLARRTGYFISGMVYLFFLIASCYVLFPNAKVWQKEEMSYITKILHLPAGNIAVAIAGAFTFGYGIFEIVRALKGGFKHHLSLQQVKESKKKAFSAIGALGYIARGVVLCLAGFFVIRAAFQAYVEQAAFTSKALEFLSHHLGSMIMGIIAAGLALYGFFMFVKAQYYQVSTS